MKGKWEDEVNVRIDEGVWEDIFICCFKTACNNNIIWFQTKLLYPLLDTSSYLHKLHIVDKCAFCGQPETILHNK